MPNSTHPIPVRLNLAISLTQVVSMLALLWVASKVSGWGLLIAALAFGIMTNSVYAMLHEAEHGMAHPDRRINDAIGVVLAWFFPAPFHLIRQGHLGHHLRNRSDDEAFDYYFEGDHKVWKHLVLYGILTGFYYVVVVLSNVVFLILPFREDKKYWHVDQASTAFMESLNPRYHLVIRLECAAAILLHVGIIHWFRLPVMHYLAMYASFGFMWSAMQYVHHYGTERHVTRGARNLWIWKPLDLLWLNHNWHLTHHSHPAVPWIHLPHVEVDGHAQRGFLVTAYLRMWRGPKLAVNQVKNSHAGKVIP